MAILQDISTAARRFVADFLDMPGTNLDVGRLVEQMPNHDRPQTLQPKSNLRILVVEDEAIVGMLIEDILAELGCFHVEVAGSVESALDSLAEDRPDFAILDVNLKGMRSYPVADFLKSRAIPFIFMSGYGSGALDRAYAGAKILPKPFRPCDLEMAVKEVLPGSQPALGSC
jgi:CheY-like chemotaxis protein